MVIGLLSVPVRKLAVILAVPAATPWANPVPDTVTTPVLSLCQLTRALTSWLVRLLKLAVALSWA
ncbi:hypothetical protein D3C85_845120 [compost metagenome]